MECNFSNELEQLRIDIEDVRCKADYQAGECEKELMNARSCIANLEEMIQPDSIVASIHNDMEVLKRFRRIIYSPEALEMRLAEYEKLREENTTLVKVINEKGKQILDLQENIASLCRATLTYKELYELLYHMAASFTQYHQSESPTAEEYYVKAIMEVINTLKVKENKVNGK